MITNSPCESATSDSDLARAAGRGDKEAFVAIVARHQAMVCSVTLGVLGDFGAGEDAAQEAFVRAWRNIRNLREPEKLRAWLAQIARCAALRLLERSRSRPAVMLAENSGDGEQPSPDQLSVSKEEAALVWEALAKLPEIYRLPLVLFYRQDQSTREVAEALELSEDAVKQRLARGRELLRGRVMGLIGSVLSQTRPGAVFTIGVASAMGALSVPATVSGACVASTAGASPATTTTSIITIMTASKISIVAAALAIAGSFFLGRLTVSPEPENGSKKIPADKERRGSPAVAGSRSGTGNTGDKAEANATSGDGAKAGDEWRNLPAGPERAAAVTEKAKIILSEKNPARRLRLFSEFIEHFTAEDFDSVAAGFAYHDQQGRLFGPEYNLFLATAGMVGGEATMKKIFKEGDPMDRPPWEGHKLALTAWAVEDSKGAVTWWNTLPEGVGKDALAKALISGVAAKNVDYAWSCLNAFPETERGRFMGSLVREKIGNEGAEAAVQWLGKLQSPDGTDVASLKRTGFDSLLSATVNISPAKKSEYINQWAGEAWMQESNFPSRVAEQWAKKNGNDAVTWADGLSGSMRENTMLTALSTWMTRDPSGFEAWKTTHQEDAKYHDSIQAAEGAVKAQAEEAARAMEAVRQKQ